MFFVTVLNQAHLDKILLKAKQKMCGCTNCACSPESVSSTYTKVAVSSQGVWTPEIELPLVRTVNFTDCSGEANELVQSNKYDIHDGKYKYAVIEQIFPGTYPVAHGHIDWYEWSDTLGKYESILMTDEMIDYLAIDSDTHASIATIG